MISGRFLPIAVIVLVLGACGQSASGPSEQGAGIGVRLTAAADALERDDLGVAEQEYRAAVKADAASADAQFGLGNVLVRAGRLAEAEQAYGKAVEANPRHAAALANLGVVYYQQGRLEEAARVLTEALRLGEDAPTTYLLAAVRLQQSDLPAAEKLLQRAQTLDAGLPEVYYGLGVLHRLRGENAAAIAAFQRFLEIGPGQDPAAVDHARAELEALEAAP
jgi:Tfp pilus assembly protein PilF